jgi:hypothetical protein
VTTAKNFPPLKEKRLGDSVSYNPNLGVENNPHSIYHISSMGVIISIS